MIFEDKKEVRNFVWKTLKENGVCAFPCEGHIPNFVGVKETILKIIELGEYKKARRIFVSPDTPQRLLVKFALSKKEVYMATPRLRKGFCRVKNYGSLKEILRNSEIVGWDIPKIDFALIGSVAVDLKGNRIGKGGGFGDREIKILREINPKVVVATNVHDLQVFKDLSYLMDPWDQRIDKIITPTRVLKAKS